ncbi:hypothetical protein PsorP6_018604 [Peronosclerospora sorghi]|nr:hypothetical protein PsorP6_018604 [Peronosclerospora sorghi]
MGSRVLVSPRERGANMSRGVAMRTCSASGECDVSRAIGWNEFSEFILDDGHFGSCFEAFDESTLFTGIVLTDGYACSWGLPVDISQQKRFVSLFGHCNFEVFSTNGVFRTERKYFDRLYDFALEDEELFIQELCAEPSEKSRGRYNYVRSIGFITPNLSNATTEKFFSLVLVPFSDHKRPYDEITSCHSDYNWLIKKEKVLVEVFSVLAKLENIQFLYALRSPEGVLKIELLVSS